MFTTPTEDPDGTRTLLLGYPTENTPVRLVIDVQGRPLREALTDADHLTSRTFSYPEAAGG